MSNEIKRPFSVWLTQAVLFFGMLQLSLALLLALFFCVTKNEIPQCLSQPRNSFFVSGFILPPLMLITFRGLQKRRSYGKWLSVVFLAVATIGTSIHGQYFQLFYNSITQLKPLPAPPYVCWKGSLASVDETYCGYSSYLDLALRTAVDILSPGVVLGFLAIRLVTSRAARRFFSKIEIS